MLKIRLRKPGKSIKRRYHFKIVVMESSRARDSKFVDSVGYYDPARNLLKFDVEKYQDWIKKGAKPTETVESLFKRYKKQIDKERGENVTT
jgi:small subunit ribosomal protein S16